MALPAMNEPHISVSGYPRYRYRAVIGSKPNYRTVILTDVRYIGDDTLAYSQITVKAGRWSHSLPVGDTVTFTASPEPNGRLTWIRRIPTTSMPRGWQVSDAKRYERRQLLLEHQSGKSIAELAVAHGVQRQTISARLKQAHADLALLPPPNFHPTTDVTPSQVAELYRQPGVTKRQIRLQLQIGSGTVNSLLRQAGIGNLCRRCKAEPAPPGHSFCPPCTAIRRTEHRRQANRNYAKRKRQQHDPAADNSPPENPHPASPVTPEQAAELYRQPGISVRDASRQLNISRDVLRTLLSRAGVGKLCQDCKNREPAAGRTFCQPCATARQIAHKTFPPRTPALPGPLRRRHGLRRLPTTICPRCGQPDRRPRAGQRFCRPLEPRAEDRLLVRLHRTQHPGGQPLLHHQNRPRRAVQNPASPLPDTGPRRPKTDAGTTTGRHQDIRHRRNARDPAPRGRSIPATGLHRERDRTAYQLPPSDLGPEPIINLYRQPGLSKTAICRRLHIQLPNLNAVLRRAGIGLLCLRCKGTEIPAQKITCPQCARKR